MKAGSFAQFWKYYRVCHSDRRNQWLHFTGATLFAGLALLALFAQWYWLLPVAVFIGYWLPHIGHRHYQHNQSLRTSHPVYCVLGAARLYLLTWRQILTLPVRLVKARRRVTA